MLWSTKAKHIILPSSIEQRHIELIFRPLRKFLYHNGESCWLFHIAFFVTFSTIRNHFRGIPSKIYNFRRNLTRKLREQICNRREQVVRAGCKLFRANCQSKYQHCGGSLQSCAEKNIRFDCNTSFNHVMPFWIQGSVAIELRSNFNFQVSLV